MNLNERALSLCQAVLASADRLRVVAKRDESGCLLVDLGIKAAGGLEAGVALAEICLAGLGRVSLSPSQPDIGTGAAVVVATDHPVAACMASQYAGWQVASKQPNFFAMGSGPMRAAAGREELFDRIGHRESPQGAVGVLESGCFPPAEVCRELADACGVAPKELTLLIAPTASQAGTVQIVARSVETALHKMLELGFDISRVESGYGVTPLPPVAADDMAGIGRTNDAVLYGAKVALWLRGDDAELEELGPQIPSSSSPDYGQPFAEIFRRYNHDFYNIDPHLFSPAEINLINLDSGRAFRYGQTSLEVLRRSFSR